MLFSASVCRGGWRKITCGAIFGKIGPRPIIGVKLDKIQLMW
jgi:hypothetical protein